MNLNAKGHEQIVGTTWLHWIGEVYYTPAKLIAEAKKLGISRRIKTQLLKQIQWGDLVLLAGKQPGTKSPVIFGYFQVEKIHGIEIPLEKMSEMIACGKITAESRKQGTEIRLCGRLVVGATYLVTGTDVEELSEYAIDPTLRGKLVLFPKPWPLMKNLSPFRGFRPFDLNEFMEDIAKRSIGKRPVMEDLYYGIRAAVVAERSEGVTLDQAIVSEKMGDRLKGAGRSFV